jgi:hypothetical protein
MDLEGIEERVLEVLIVLLFGFDELFRPGFQLF